MTKAELAKIHAIIEQLIAESAAINAEPRWRPFVMVAGVFVSALGLLKLVS